MLLSLMLTLSLTHTPQSSVITGSSNLEVLYLKPGEARNVVATLKTVHKRWENRRKLKHKQVASKREGELEVTDDSPALFLAGAILSNHDRWRPEGPTVSSAQEVAFGFIPKFSQRMTSGGKWPLRGDPWSRRKSSSG